MEGKELAITKQSEKQMQSKKTKTKHDAKKQKKREI